MSFPFGIEVKWMQGKRDFISEITDTEVIHVSPVNNLDDKADLQHMWVTEPLSVMQNAVSVLLLSAALRQSSHAFFD